MRSLERPDEIKLTLPSIEDKDHPLLARRRALENIKREVMSRVNSPGPTFLTSPSPSTYDATE